MTLPEEASIVHAEFIYFYYPDDMPFPCELRCSINLTINYY